MTSEVLGTRQCPGEPTVEFFRSYVLCTSFGSRSASFGNLQPAVSTDCPLGSPASDYWSLANHSRHKSRQRLGPSTFSASDRQSQKTRLTFHSPLSKLAIKRRLGGSMYFCRGTTVSASHHVPSFEFDHFSRATEEFRADFLTKLPLVAQRIPMATTTRGLFGFQPPYARFDDLLSWHVLQNKCP